MMPAFLLPENIAYEDGHGERVIVDRTQQRIHLTLGITRILERESLDVTICGSADGEKWEPLAIFRRKSFCGTYSLMLDLSQNPDVRFLRTAWKMHRWAQRDSKPMFSFYVWAEDVPRKALRTAALSGHAAAGS
jgi:hypothetical protein